MTTAGTALHERVLHVDGRDAAAAGREAVLLFGRDGGYHAQQVAPDTYQFTRSYRPAWAIVLGILTAPFFGLGILFFFVRRTESCTVSVEPTATGSSLRVSGKLTDAALQRLRALAGEGGAGWNPTGVDRAWAEAAAGRVPEAPSEGMTDPVAPAAALIESVPAPAAAPQAEVGDAPAPVVAVEEPAELTIARPVRATAPRPAAAMVMEGFVLRFDDGTEAPLPPRGVVGRDPAGDDAVPIRILDADHSVSKTHFAIGTDRVGIWIEDRHSTNGTAIVDAAGHPVTIPAGERVVVKPGAVVVFGERRMEVVDAR